MDVTLINSLTRSIKNLESSAQALTPASEAASSSQNYADQLEKATNQLKELNSLYSQQAKDASSHNTYNEQVAENAEQLKVQICLLYTSPSPRDRTRSRMPSSA